MLFKQISWPSEAKGTLWKIITKKKIRNQAEVLKKLNKEQKNIDLLNLYADQVEINDATNREGLAAKVYFHSLFGLEFRRDDENVINACLDYGYSIFRALISRAIVAKGLNPQLALFHKGPNNPFNLSDDIIEIFRPVVDAFVYENFLNEKIFIKEHRVKLLSLINYKLEIGGQKQTINHCIEMIVDEIINYFNTGKIDRLINLEPIVYDV